MLISEIFQNKTCPKCNRPIKADCICLSNCFILLNNELLFRHSEQDYNIYKENNHYFLHYKQFNIKINDQDINNIKNIINKLEENIVFY